MAANSFAILRKVIAKPKQADSAAPCGSDYRRLADETAANLREHVLSKWFPRSVDRVLGGFHENFGADWKPLPGSARSLVYQARLTWTAAQAAVHDGELRGGSANLNSGLSGFFA